LFFLNSWNLRPDSLASDFRTCGRVNVNLFRRLRVHIVNPLF